MLCPSAVPNSDRLAGQSEGVGTRSKTNVVVQLLDGILETRAFKTSQVNLWTPERDS